MRQLKVSEMSDINEWKGQMISSQIIGCRSFTAPVIKMKRTLPDRQSLFFVRAALMWLRWTVCERKIKNTTAFQVFTSVLRCVRWAQVVPGSTTKSFAVGSDGKWACVFCLVGFDCSVFADWRWNSLLLHWRGRFFQMAFPSRGHCLGVTRSGVYTTCTSPSSSSHRLRLDVGNIGSCKCHSTLIQWKWASVVWKTAPSPRCVN